MRIDRSDLADGPGSAHMARRLRSVPDDPDAAGKDQGRAAGGDGRSDSSCVSVDSALRMERTAAYRAAVDSAYRQYAIDHGYARVEKLERETFTPAVGRTGTEDPERHLVGPEDRMKGKDPPTEAAEPENLLVHDANGPGYATMGTVAECVLTGARGPASGREFDPETAGGPIQQLDAGKERISNEGVQEATAHLQRFTGGGPLEAPEQAMLDRLTSIAAGDIEPTSYDLNFYTHELDEAGRYARLGLGPESGVDLGSPEMYDVWNDVHTAALEDYAISGADLFYPGLAP
jgi:hypothetical protein